MQRTHSSAGWFFHLGGLSWSKGAPISVDVLSLILCSDRNYLSLNAICTRPKQAIAAKTKVLQDRLECLKMFAFTLLVHKCVYEAQKRVDNARLFDSVI